MNDRIQELAEQAEVWNTAGDEDKCEVDLEKFAELLLRNLSEELADVAQGSRKVNPEWANGMNHAATLAQRMTMNLPQWPEAE